MSYIIEAESHGSEQVSDEILERAGGHPREVRS